MSRPFHSLPPGPRTRRAIRDWLTGSFAGRALVAGAAVKLVSLLMRVTGLAPGFAETIDTAADIALVTGVAVLAFRLFRETKSVLLWRVRRKLTVSYIFIGFVPVLLVVTLFMVGGGLLFYNVSQYVAYGGVTDVVEQAAFLAESAAVGLQDSTTPEEVRLRLDRRRAGASRSFPFLSYAVVPASRICGPAPPEPPAAAMAMEPIAVGPWRHLDAPREMPAWLAADPDADGLPCATRSMLVAYNATANGEDASVATYLVARGVAWPDHPRPEFAVIVDVPIASALLDRIRNETDIDIGDFTALPCHFAQGRGTSVELPLETGQPVGPPRVRPAPPSTRNPLRRPVSWVLFLEYRDWRTGQVCNASANISMTMADLWTRISNVDAQLAGRIAQRLLAGMALVAILFLIIQVAAFIMGFTLARSITGSIHELFIGTERVRRGDFTHKIAVRSRDQLGELAESFNSMTSSIEALLQEKTEKERMEQELRIARSIQMSLLPQGGLNMPGLALTAHCEPAREVGGDYYDYLPLDDHRVAVLVADVAGKGTSAALYMAELKGVMLSLAQQHTSPRQLLIEANRIISRHLDSRSFITITYAIVDLRAGVLTYARAGHCPLIYVPGPHAASRQAQILAPDGLVLGLQIDNGERFASLLTEATIPLGPGDLFLFYTDGLTEASDARGIPFGDARLAALMQDHADLPFEDLRERIIREVEAFSAPADQQDDMTMLLLKVEDVGEHRMRAPAGTAGARAADSRREPVSGEAAAAAPRA